uniref:ZSWIM1/3 RNaseH-like domain-containing protein n=1 Tax=Amphimedon queenslandica TaxID=400682 RepID=A0A1X7UQV6_AMPQE
MQNLANIAKHKNDQTSMSLWVQEAIDQEYNPVLIYKPQGMENAIVGDIDNMAKESFLLAVQTEFQRDAMKKFGNGKAVCMDAIHGTNVYDFLVTTLMVIDNYGEGIRVGWAITYKEDTCSLVQFLKPLLERVAAISPLVFMSDDAEQYYCAWSGVYGLVPKKLLCSWHFDRAWKKAIREHISGSEQKL